MVDVSQLARVKFLKRTPKPIRNVSGLESLLTSIRKDPDKVDPLAGEFDVLDHFLGKGTGSLCYPAWHYDDKAVAMLLKKTVDFAGKKLINEHTQLRGPGSITRRRHVVEMCVEAILEKAREELPQKLKEAGDEQ